MKKAAAPGTAFEVDLAGLKERVLLQAELITREGEMRSFSTIRDRIAASGQNADTKYREIVSSRDKLAAKLRRGRPSKAGKPKVIPPARDLPLLDAPIAPARFRVPAGTFPWFGYSGFVQAGPLSDGVNVVPGGDTSGQIATTVIGAPTYAYFDGSLESGPSELPPGQAYDPTVRYFWLHNWQVLVPFPAPTGPSILTYRFNAGVNLQIFGDGIGTAMSFVSLGETANLTGPVTVNIDGGWPLIADLSQPTTTNGLYNGHYGELWGTTAVQRSFAVGSGGVPAVAIVVGVVIGLPEGASVSLGFAGDSSVGVSGTADYQGEYVGGKIAYYVQPELVAEPLA